ncbi:shuttle craft like transcriptional repressor/ubiquitin-protein ligase E3 [Schizosaccharomyces osmophilus]|uniref:Shuttle craft like transcriptional repressor/ubiquitin-protein ligase E3 n=1 Tax=Schizosaccharomyces osmophilus TaxID=2545709 RepID=A0AAE9WHF3_9SCHI|nr:shuttle craft like transcriptional repressor/ubiquitin-protein ligase E3 [Schizosaccharomyces osmophilus]WBW75474.1 shuttle craft like transcriptional repressor/ubiquitin-protein ligase E3 [Schizosaccharomyces osmophilus]
METSKNSPEAHTVKKGGRKFPRKNRNSSTQLSSSKQNGVNTEHSKTTSATIDGEPSGSKRASSAASLSADAPSFVPGMGLLTESSFGNRSNETNEKPSNSEKAEPNSKKNRNRNRKRPSSTKKVDGVSTEQFNDTASSKRNGREHNRKPSNANAEKQNETNKPKEEPKASKGKKREGSKKPKESIDLSKLDMTSRMIFEIKKMLYECSVCTDIVKTSTPVWTCSTCFHAFHLKCTRKWMKNSIEQRNEPVWRCPSCQTPQKETSLQYTCWCGKQDEPESVKGLTPHSCGEPCGRTRGQDCVHPCPLLCHPGPCPPCTATVEQFCLCGKESKITRCSGKSRAPQESFRCENICGEVLPCSKHTCKQRCHSGLCGACYEPIRASCYCGAHSKTYTCSVLPDPISCVRLVDGTVAEYNGYYSCGSFCEQYFDCGIHRCSKVCHPRSKTLEQCPLSPSIVAKCFCGKKNISDLLNGSERNSCEDSIPTCGNICLKQLPCGHQCKQNCHPGSCGSCQEVVTVPCRCKFNSVQVSCEELQKGYIPTCERLCSVLLSCGRHECNKKCCSGYPKAQARLALRPKGALLRYHLLSEEFEEEHICLRPCNKKLGCGNHSCNHMCHRGPCPRCLEASFEELTCTCGRTKLYPPIPCGTPIPSCPYLCTLPKSCGHPQVKHNCHPPSEPCPFCPYLVKKNCLCGKHLMENQPCSKENVRCGTVCGKLLGCGIHKCEKTCHREGECESVCRKPCGKRRLYCEHTCELPCHSEIPCDQKVSCKAMVAAVCSCGLIKTQVSCGASFENPSPEHKISCTVDCAREERKRVLADALNINPDRKGKEVSQYTKSLLIYYRDNREFGREIETALCDLCESEKPSVSFPPMQREQRWFIHTLAKLYGAESESFDSEPKRNVVVYNKGMVKTPGVFLKEALDYYSQHPTMLLQSDSAFSNAPSSNASKTVGAGQEEIFESSYDSEYNALFITDFRKEGEISEEEIRNALADIGDFESITWSIFRVENGIVMKPLGIEDIAGISSRLIALRALVNPRMLTANIADRCDVCQVNEENVVSKIRMPRIRSKKKAFLKLAPSQSLSAVNPFETLERDIN